MIWNGNAVFRSAMKIFVITPYFMPDPDWLMQAHQSVVHQLQPAQHVLVNDGGPAFESPAFTGTQIVLKRNYADYGNTPRLIGCTHAISQGADAIAFLDSDNWYQPQHLENLVAFAKENQLDACASSRLLHRLDGTVIVKCPIVNGKEYIDTNCLMILKPAFQFIITWGMAGQEQAAVTNQALWAQMRDAGARLGFLNRPTVCYRTRHASHYRMAGETPPPDAFDRLDDHGALYRPPHHSPDHTAEEAAEMVSQIEPA